MHSQGQESLLQKGSCLPIGATNVYKMPKIEAPGNKLTWRISVSNKMHPFSSIHVDTVEWYLLISKDCKTLWLARKCQPNGHYTTYLYTPFSKAHSLTTEFEFVLTAD